jgi:hypothetical protein
MSVIKIARLTLLPLACAFSFGCAVGGAPRGEPATPAMRPVDPVADLITKIDPAQIGVTVTGSDHVYKLPGFEAYGTADVHLLEREYHSRPMGGVLLLELAPPRSTAQ